jgi:hypothetical protein
MGSADRIFKFAFPQGLFNDNSVHQEALPDKRFKIPLGVRELFPGGQSDSESVLPLLYRRLGLEIQYFQSGKPVKISPLFR